MSVARDQARHRRHRRVRKKIRGTATRPRLAVFRSNKFTYAQAIDDDAGATLATSSTASIASGTKPIDAAEAVGKALGEQLRELGITTAVFDRGGYRYHGRVAAVADGARDAGLEL